MASGGIGAARERRPAISFGGVGLQLPADEGGQVGQSGTGEPVPAPRACAGLVNAVNWKRGRPARTLRLSPLVSLTAGEVMAGESMSGRMSAALCGCAEKLLPAGVRSSLVSASEALARARPRQEQR
jgi:hypothetical protein